MEGKARILTTLIVGIVMASAIGVYFGIIKKPTQGRRRGGG